MNTLILMHSQRVKLIILLNISSKIMIYFYFKTFQKERKKIHTLFTFIKTVTKLILNIVFLENIDKEDIEGYGMN